jgi:hypothetical protein
MEAWLATEPRCITAGHRDDLIAAVIVCKTAGSDPLHVRAADGDG